MVWTNSGRDANHDGIFVMGSVSRSDTTDRNQNVPAFVGIKDAKGHVFGCVAFCPYTPIPAFPFEQPGSIDPQLVRHAGRSRSGNR